MRARALLAGAVAAAALAGAAPALAGTYTWSLPRDFSPAGANPDHGPYADTPWIYADRVPGGALTRLGQFQTGVQGGLSGWSDTGDSGAFVGTNPSSDAIVGGTNNEDTFQPGQMVLEPSPQHAVAIGWTAPLSGVASVAATVVSDETAGAARSACASLGWDTWTLERDGSPVQEQGGSVPDSTQVPQTISASVSVAAGQELALVVTAGSAVSADPGCAPAAVTLQVQQASAPPSPTLAAPAPGTVISDGQPLFSGTGSTVFGAGAVMTVRVYRGTRASPGALVETLTASRAGAAFSVPPTPFLYDGTYTAQVEQDNLAGDHGLSPAVTFKVADPLPPISLRPVGRVLRTRTPTFSGTGGLLDGDSRKIDVYVWAGTRAHGYPLRHLTAPLQENGRWRLRLPSPLRNGRYVVIAVQNGPAGLIGSQPARFAVKVGRARRK